MNFFLKRKKNFFSPIQGNAQKLNKPEINSYIKLVSMFFYFFVSLIDIITIQFKHCINIIEKTDTVHCEVRAAELKHIKPPNPQSLVDC